ncbi:hypothetical protein CFC21_091463 [Triticum aestivum]|uniref:Uncharacterized protein n=3 Tax=Triticinae TaxID=1648030 RepID=A0A453N474_AEGTS|nr:uncharacterized protein LOC109762503 [Aegilops tauschii subsp. strangulata]XP_044418364.1 uncharacterized protein LOC123143493 [Triticum aestivum]KAF7088340.1 hypothetical protein CFC21_091463 [Triticum aestivum]
MASPPPPPPQVNLVDDVVAEILLRLPPDEPEHLFRAALVCKPWLRVICDPAFRRRYRAFHGAPPLLGLLHRTQVCDGDPAARFASTTSMPDFPHPGSDGRRTRPLDCRHGRVLIHMLQDPEVDLLVWDPVTGDRHVVPEPDIDWMIYTAAVFCAAAGCDHLDCHGGPFRVVFLATDDHDEVVKASVYSSVTGAWSAPVSLDESCECYARHKRDATAKRRYFIPYVQPRRVAAIGDAVYFTLSRSSAIAKYDCGKNRLSVIDPPPPDTEVYGGFITLMVMEDNSLGLAGVKDFSLHLWSRKVNGAAKWVPCMVIDLQKIMPMAKPLKGNGANVVGFAEGLGVIFVSTEGGLFTIDLKSRLLKKVDEPGVYFSVLPYMSFYTPDRGRLLSLARLTDA